MPIYEYQCEECQQIFEELVFDKDQEVSCPSCNSARTSKLMSCCRAKVDKAGPIAQASSPAGSGSCAGCSGGNCSSCG